MILTHNYYIDFLKAFNQFLLKIFNSDLKRGDGTLNTSLQNIQKITYNIGSKTILTHQLYNNENFEYPNIYIDLADIRVSDEGISPIARNAFGLISSPFTAFPCKNYTRDQNILVDTKRYLLNFNVQINVENQADLLNFYHTITNFYPLNFTFIDFDFDYLIDISEIAKDWNSDDDVINLIIADYSTLNQISDKPNEKNDKRFFTAINVQPEIEFTSITKQEDLENMKFSLTLSVLISASIPFIIYSNYDEIVKEIIVNVDFNDSTEYPIFFDTMNIFKDQNIIRRIQIKDIQNKDDEIKIFLADKIPEKYKTNNFYLIFQDNVKNILNLPLDKKYKKDNEYITEKQDSEYIIITKSDEKYSIIKQMIKENNIEKILTFSYFYILD